LPSGLWLVLSCPRCASGILHIAVCILQSAVALSLRSSRYRPLHRRLRGHLVTDEPRSRRRFLDPALRRPGPRTAHQGPCAQSDRSLDRDLSRRLDRQLCGYKHGELSRHKPGKRPRRLDRCLSRPLPRLQDRELSRLRHQPLNRTERQARPWGRWGSQERRLPCNALTRLRLTRVPSLPAPVTTVG
jgi:hypothetical protein